MPAIVDRSPVIVAIGSSGQSPTLVRRVRTQLEALLPARLGELARLAAGRARGYSGHCRTSNSGGASGTGCSPAASPPRYLLAMMPGGGAARCATRGPARVPRGEVYLIGAGPGRSGSADTARAAVAAAVRRRALRSPGQRSGARSRAPGCGAHLRRQGVRAEHRVTQQRIHALLLEYASRGTARGPAQGR